MRRILFLAWAEVLHVTRDRATLAQIFMMPIVQLLLLSNAATFTIRDTPAAIVDLDRTPSSRGLVNRFAASPHFELRGHPTSTAIANDAMLDGEVTMTITIPAGFEESIVRTGVGNVQVQLNAEKGTAAGIVQFYASHILSAYADELAVELHPRGGVDAAADVITPRRGKGGIDVRVRSWYNPSLNYKHYMVPGILVLLVTVIGTLLTAQNVARERELGTLEQLNVTPITRGQFIIAKMLPFWALAMIVLTIGLLVGKFVFGIPVRGNPALLFGVAAIYLVVALGIGLFISTLVDTQQQATFVSFFIVMIYNLMSGLFTPIDSMPHWAQVVAEFNPVRHFVSISRAILIKGAGLQEIARPLVILIVYGAVVMTLAVRQYSKRTA